MCTARAAKHVGKVSEDAILRSCHGLEPLLIRPQTRCPTDLPQALFVLHGSQDASLHVCASLARHSAVQPLVTAPSAPLYAPQNVKPISVDFAGKPCDGTGRCQSWREFGPLSIRGTRAVPRVGMSRGVGQGHKEVSLSNRWRLGLPFADRHWRSRLWTTLSFPEVSTAYYPLSLADVFKTACRISQSESQATWFSLPCPAVAISLGSTDLSLDPSDTTDGTSDR